MGYIASIKPSPTFFLIFVATVGAPAWAQPSSPTVQSPPELKALTPSYDTSVPASSRQLKGGISVADAIDQEKNIDWAGWAAKCTKQVMENFGPEPALLPDDKKLMKTLIIARLKLDFDKAGNATTSFESFARPFTQEEVTKLLDHRKDVDKAGRKEINRVLAANKKLVAVWQKKTPEERAEIGRQMFSGESGDGDAVWRRQMTNVSCPLPEGTHLRSVYVTMGWGALGGSSVTETYVGQIFNKAAQGASQREQSDSSEDSGSGDPHSSDN